MRAVREAAADGKTLKQIAAEIGRSSPVITLAGYRARPTPHAAKSDAGDGPHTPDHAVHGGRVDADRVLGADRDHESAEDLAAHLVRVGRLVLGGVGLIATEYCLLALPGING